MNIEPIVELEEWEKNYDFIQEFGEEKEVEYNTVHSLSGVEENYLTAVDRGVFINAGIPDVIDVDVEYHGVREGILEELFGEIIHIIKRKYEGQDFSQSEIQFNKSNRTADAYYYDSGGDEGVYEISFRGDEVTESEIRAAVNDMIEEMKKNDIL